MKAIPFVDQQGYFVEDVLVTSDSFTGAMNHAKVDKEPAIMGYAVGYPVPAGLYKPRLDVARLIAKYSDDAQKWPDGSDADLARSFWIEGLTPEEISEINKPVLTEADKIRHEMAEQNAGMWDFILSGGA